VARNIADLYNSKKFDEDKKLSYIERTSGAVAFLSDFLCDENNIKLPGYEI
jgi:predicted transcriptional regulator of viral defense system